jgi:acyl-CoA dehydrogenase
MWDFETDAEYQAKLDWADKFVREEIEPLRLILDNPFDVNDPYRNALIKPLQAKVKEHGLWATHLPPELGRAWRRTGQAGACSTRSSVARHNGRR